MCRFDILTPLHLASAEALGKFRIVVSLASSSGDGFFEEGKDVSGGQHLLEGKGREQTAQGELEGLG